MSFRSITKRSVGLAAALILTSTGAFAENVTLRSLDGSVSMGGELVSFDGTYYVLKSALGQVQILAVEVVCEGEFCPDLSGTDFRLAGSSTIAQVLLPSLFLDFSGGYNLNLSVGDASVQDGVPVQQYLFEHGNGDVFADVEIHSQGSEAAFASLLDGSAEIALSSRAITAPELADFAAEDLGDLTDSSNQVVAALDGLVVIVPPENDLPSLSMAELTQIFAGRITNWSQLGGANAPINTYRRDDASGSAHDFAQVVLNPAGAGFTNSSKAFTDDISLVRAVMNDPNGIGFTSIAYQQDSRALPLRGTCGFLSTPTEFTVKTGEYPLSRRVYLYTTDRMYGSISKERSDKAMGFMAFVQSEAGQNAAEQSGFVSQLVSTLPISIQGQRMVNTMIADPGDVPFADIREMVAALSGGERLSTTFRFKPSVAELDAQARGDIPRLAAYLLANDLGGKEILLAGFSDAEGGAPQNATLSQRRAQQVLDELRAALGADAGKFKFVVEGFGEVSPQGCNDSALGRSVNRRVEVWVREAL